MWCGRKHFAFFSSDNGPWLTYYDLGGTSGPWRDGKITSWEGGFRVPAIFWWPKTIQPAVVNGIGVNVDLISTIASLTAVPAGRIGTPEDIAQAAAFFLAEGSGFINGQTLYVCGASSVGRSGV